MKAAIDFTAQKSKVEIENFKVVSLSEKLSFKFQIIKPKEPCLKKRIF